MYWFGLGPEGTSRRQNGSMYQFKTFYILWVADDTTGSGDSFLPLCTSEQLQAGATGCIRPWPLSRKQVCVGLKCFYKWDGVWLYTYLTLALGTNWGEWLTSHCGLFTPWGKTRNTSFPCEHLWLRFFLCRIFIWAFVMEPMILCIIISGIKNYILSSCDKEVYVSFAGMQATNEHPARFRQMSECQRCTSAGASTRRDAVHATNEVHVQPDECWWWGEPYQAPTDQLGHVLARVHASNNSLAWTYWVWVATALWFVIAMWTSSKF